MNRLVWLLAMGVAATADAGELVVIENGCTQHYNGHVGIFPPDPGVPDGLMLVMVDSDEEPQLPDPNDRLHSSDFDEIPWSWWIRYGSATWWIESGRCSRMDPQDMSETVILSCPFIYSANCSKIGM